jgi:hypothetical protein
LVSQLETSFLALWLKEAVPSYIAALLEMLLVIYFHQGDMSGTRITQTMEAKRLMAHLHGSSDGTDARLPAILFSNTDFFFSIIP